MAYSTDLRTKALDYIEKGGSKEMASQIFGVTLRTLFNWIKRKKMGCLAPNKRKERTPHKIDNEKLKAYLEQHPDAYLREIAEHLGAAMSTVFYACRRLKINLKKRLHSIEKGTRKKGKNFKACAQQGAKIEQKQISSLKELQDFDMTIVAAGAETLQLPELASLPLSLVKGQVLEFSWPRNRAPLSCALNSHVYLLMTESRTSCLVGATYEKGHDKALIDLTIAQRELIPKAIALFPPLKEAAIMNCYTGMRAVTPQHLPLIQCLSPTQWILTGMGSKGLLYHALLAKELVQNMTNGEVCTLSRK